MKKLFSLIMIVALLAVFAPVISAAPPAQGQEYIVTAGDWLSKIADKYLGNPQAWPAVMQATNQKSLEDSSFAKIANADLIEPGWKLWVPSTEEAEAFLATYDPNKPEMLYAPASSAATRATPSSSTPVWRSKATAPSSTWSL
jgi:LysM repeat protein